MSTSPKKKLQFRRITSSILVVEVLAIVGVISLLYQRPAISEIEKRPLAAKPEFSLQALFTGNYTKELAAYYADTFPGRELLVKFSGKLDSIGGVRVDDVRIHEGNPDPEFIPGEEAPAPEVPVLPSETPAILPSEASPSLEQPTEAATEEGVKMGSIFLYRDRGYQLFGGTDAMGEWYANVLSSYQTALEGKVQIYNLIVPSSAAMGLPERYASMTSPEPPKLQNIADHLDPAIIFVNPYETMAAHKKEYLYFRTDHHWTALGAYYAYTEFAKAAGFSPIRLEELEKRTLPNFLGTLYSQTKDPKMEKNPDHVDYYMMPVKSQCELYLKGSPFQATTMPLYGEYAKTYNSYSVFLHGDAPVTRISTDVNNGKRIAVVKESYGNAFVPFLVNHYEEVLVIDQRYLERDLYALLREEEIDELLFINNIFSAHTPVRIKELVSLPHRAEPVSSSDSAVSSSTEASEALA